MVELVARARQRLDDALVETFDEERRRFDVLAPVPADLEALAADLREAADETGRLPAVIPMDALGLFSGGGDAVTDDAGDDAAATETERVEGVDATASSQG
jgi:hypothetical protein